MGQIKRSTLAFLRLGLGLYSRGLCSLGKWGFAHLVGLAHFLCKLGLSYGGARVSPPSSNLEMVLTGLFLVGKANLHNVRVDMGHQLAYF